MINFSNFLKQFTNIPTESMQALLDLFQPVELNKNNFLAKEGERSKSLYFVESGVLRAYYQNPKGEEFNKLFFVNPAIVGAYSSLITGETNKINIQCLSNCLVLKANFQSILKLYDAHPTIERLNRTIAEDFFVKKEKREMSLVMNNASERYAMFQEEFSGLENEITQYHIASYLGITPTQLSRIRAKKD